MQPTHTAPCSTPRYGVLKFSAEAPRTGCQVVAAQVAEGGGYAVTWVPCGQPPFGLATGWGDVVGDLVACFHHLVVLDDKIPIQPLPHTYVSQVPS